MRGLILMGWWLLAAAGALWIVCIYRGKRPVVQVKAMSSSAFALEPTKEQHRALAKAEVWWKEDTSNPFLLTGDAGTVKRTMMPLFAALLRLKWGQIELCCFTGKAATERIRCNEEMEKAR